MFVLNTLICHLVYGEKKHNPTALRLFRNIFFVVLPARMHNHKQKTKKDAGFVDRHKNTLVR